MATLDPWDQEPLEFDGLDLSADEVGRRFRWANRQGHPRYLWPEVPVPVWRTWLVEIARVTAAALHPAGPTPALEPVGRDALGLSVAAFTSGMGPLLGLWAESGRLEAPAGIRRVLDLHLAHGRARADRIAGEARLLLDTLEGAGIGSTVLKGTDTGRRVFDEPGARPSSDVDLLVEPGRIQDAEAVLAGAGYRCVSTRRRRKPRSDWASPAEQEGRLRSLFLTHAATPIHIDLHGTLDRDILAVFQVRFGREPELRVRPFPELHPWARSLEEPLLTAFLAMHASAPLTSLTLIRVVEVVLVIRQGRERGTMDWEELDSLLRRTGAIRFAFPALQAAERLAPGTIEPRFLARVEDASPPRVRSLMAGRTPASLQRLEELSVGERLMWARGPVELLRTLWELVLPTGITSIRDLLRLYGQRVRRLLEGRVRFGAGQDG